MLGATSWLVPLLAAEEVSERAAPDMQPGFFVMLLTVFVLAMFVGTDVINRVPPLLHTPLMSGSNAVSGITIVGALVVCGTQPWLSTLLGFVAVVFATINCVGGFLVTHRMLAMFKTKQ